VYDPRDRRKLSERNAHVSTRKGAPSVEAVHNERTIPGRVQNGCPHFDIVFGSADAAPTVHQHNYGKFLTDFRETERPCKRNDPAFLPSQEFRLRHVLYRYRNEVLPNELSMRRWHTEHQAGDDTGCILPHFAPPTNC